jgi:hypothetical protein
MVRVSPPQQVADDERRARLVAEYLTAKCESDRLTSRMKDIRGALLSEFDSLESDMDGHVTYILPEDRRANGKGLLRQRRVSRKVDAEAFAAFRVSHPQLVLHKQIEVPDEDALMAALIVGDVTDADVDALYPAAVTYALIPVKK